MKSGDLVIILNSGGKMGILVEPWPKDKEFSDDGIYHGKLFNDGWKVFHQQRMKYIYMESEFLELA